MNILIDQHHSDLLESLHRLFEDRLGFKVYVPHGLDWFAEGYWQFGRWTFGDDRLGRQFLLGPDVDPLQPDRTLRRVTLEEAKGMDWDVVVATVQDNYSGLARFAAEKGARFVVEVGNVNQPVPPDALILDSTGKYPNGVQFTPEFDLEWCAEPLPADIQLGVASFVNLFTLLPCYPTYEVVREIDHTENWHVYGHEADFIKPTSKVIDLMKTFRWGWHDKITGDGFGYVIHYWAAVGRPLIGHASHYAGQLAEDLWVDGVTCIDLDKHSPKAVALMIKALDWAQMGRNINEIVRKRLDFKADAERVAESLGMAVAA